jgi:hypothetical protein
MLKFPDVIMNATIHIVNGVLFSFETSKTIANVYFKKVCIPLDYMEELGLFTLLDGVTRFKVCRYKFH